MSMAHNAAGNPFTSTRHAGYRATMPTRSKPSSAASTSLWLSTARDATYSSPIRAMYSRWHRATSPKSVSTSPANSNRTSFEIRRLRNTPLYKAAQTVKRSLFSHLSPHDFLLVALFWENCEIFHCPTAIFLRENCYFCAYKK